MDMYGLLHHRVVNLSFLLQAHSRIYSTSMLLDTVCYFTLCVISWNVKLVVIRTFNSVRSSLLLLVVVGNILVTKFYRGDMLWLLYFGTT